MTRTFVSRCAMSAAAGRDQRAQQRVEIGDRGVPDRHDLRDDLVGRAGRVGRVAHDERHRPLARPLDLDDLVEVAGSHGGEAVHLEDGEQDAEDVLLRDPPRRLDGDLAADVRRQHVVEADDLARGVHDRLDVGVVEVQHDEAATLGRRRRRDRGLPPGGRGGCGREVTGGTTGAAGGRTGGATVGGGAMAGDGGGGGCSAPTVTVWEGAVSFGGVATTRQQGQQDDCRGYISGASSHRPAVGEFARACRAARVDGWRRRHRAWGRARWRHGGRRRRRTSGELLPACRAPVSAASPEERPDAAGSDRAAAP